MQYGPVTSSIHAEEGVQHMATKTAQGVVGGCIYLGKRYFTDNVTQISSYCHESANMITSGSLDNSSVIL